MAASSGLGGTRAPAAVATSRRAAGSRRRSRAAARRLRAAAGAGLDAAAVERPPPGGGAQRPLPARRARRTEPAPRRSGLQSGDPLAARRRSAARATEGPRAEPAARGRGAVAAVRRRGAAGRAAGARSPRASRTPPQSRAQAREILHERRFQRQRACRGRSRACCAGSAIGCSRSADFIDDLAVRIPGGRPVLFVAPRRARPARRRGCSRAARSAAGRPPPSAPPAPARPTREDPAALERDADRAAAAGEWETAVRLRFRAGLLRLDARELIEYRPSLTTGEVADAVGSPGVRARRRGLRRDRLRRPPRRRGRRGREPRGLAARAQRGAAVSRLPLPKSRAARAGLAVLAVLVAINVDRRADRRARAEPERAGVVVVRHEAGRASRRGRSSPSATGSACARCATSPSDAVARRRAARSRSWTPPALTGDEARALRAFAERGGRVIAGGEPGGWTATLLGRPSRRTGTTTGRRPRGRSAPAPETAGVGASETAGDGRWERPAGRALGGRRGLAADRARARAAGGSRCSPTPRRSRTACSTRPTTPRSRSR